MSEGQDEARGSRITITLCERDLRGNKTGNTKTFESTSGEQISNFFSEVTATAHKGNPKKPQHKDADSVRKTIGKKPSIMAAAKNALNQPS